MKILESELEEVRVDLCTSCGEYEGSIWLCSEGSFCAPCFSREAGIDEEEAFAEEIPQEYRDNARKSLSFKKDLSLDK